MAFSRRDFLTTAVVGSLSLGLESQEQKQQDSRKAQTRTLAGKRPIIVSSASGYNYLDDAYNFLRGGGDTLDAALRVVKGAGDDPNDHSVGLGGLPNEEGVVELDACCMHGPTRRAGAVGGVRNIKNVSFLARAVMEHSGHVMLVGEGAERFAIAQGFPKENLLTERSRKIWMLWKETHSNQDWWGPGVADPNWKPPQSLPISWRLKPADIQSRIAKLESRAAELGIQAEYCRQAALRVLFPPTGTIHVSAVNEKGEMSGATTTSGLAWKLPGRVGDSPIIGAGCYTDQDVGSDGATGSGEENIKVAGAHTIVENMRKGMSPHEAGMDCLKRIARNHNNDMTRLRYLDMVYYILRKDGAYAGVSLWSDSSSGHHTFAVHDGTKRLEKTVALFQGASIDWPIEPKLREEAK